MAGLALILALFRVKPAPFCVLDEVDAPLDEANGARFNTMLSEMSAASQVVVVTHNPEEAFRLCDDIVILVNGRVRTAGAKHHIATNPMFRDVAEVLGYTVLSAAGRVSAIPEGALRLATGPTELSAIVDTVLDVVHEWDVIATIGTTRVHVGVPRSQVPPQSGDGIFLTARVMYDVS